MPDIKLYDLSLSEPIHHWSPNTCKTRFALNLKGIPYDVQFLNFFEVHSEIPKITKTGKRPTVPVIEDLRNSKVVQDSWEIAQYLEKEFPNTPTLFPGNFDDHKRWHDYANTKLMPVLFKFAVLHVSEHCGSPEMEAWFRKNREELFGVTLEQIAGDPATRIDLLKTNLQPVHDTLASTGCFLTGDRAGLADTTVAAILNFLAALKPDDFENYVLNAFPDDVLKSWWTRMEPCRGVSSLSPHL